MSKVKVVGGSIGEGEWFYGGGRLIKSFGNDKIELANSTIEKLTEEKVKKLAGTAGWGITGGILLGPLGAIGGILLGGNKQQVSFACNLSDGRKFIGITDSKTYAKIVASSF